MAAKAHEFAPQIRALCSWMGAYVWPGSQAAHYRYTGASIRSDIAVSEAWFLPCVLVEAMSAAVVGDLLASGTSWAVSVQLLAAAPCILSVEASTALSAVLPTLSADSHQLDRRKELGCCQHTHKGLGLQAGTQPRHTPHHRMDPCSAKWRDLTRIRKHKALQC